MLKVNYITKPYKRIPDRLIFNTKKEYPLCPIFNREIARVIEIRKSRILGEIITEPVTSDIFGTQSPPVKSLSIVKLKSFVRNEGVGTDLLNFAKRLSVEKGCEGRIHLVSSDCYDKENPPHVFYRKFGFTSHETEKLRDIDSQIATGTPEYFIFEDLGMFYPPEKFRHEFKKKDIDKDAVDCKNILKNFIKSLFSKYK